MTSDILIVDDEADIRNLIRGILEDEGYTVREAANSDETSAAIAKKLPQLVILDIWLQGSARDGMEILEHLKAAHPDMPVVMISGHGTIETAVNAIKIGAYDFIEKPFKSDRLLLMIRRALEAASLKRENAVLRRKAEPYQNELTGTSQAAEHLRQMIGKIAPTNSRVLLTGEPGTGKDIAARLIHSQSERAAGPFLSVNCAMLEPERLEAELFGQLAREDDEPAITGLLEQAHGGTLVLDQIADMPLETQGKIMRVLQEQKFCKLGSSEPLEVDVRIIAATNRNLDLALQEGRFRQDLYYRLNVVPLSLPPLRERREDIPALIDAFLSEIFGTADNVRSFTPEAVDLLTDCEWPGNVRQLRNVVEWVSIMHSASGETVYDVRHLPPDLTDGHDSETSKPGREGTANETNETNETKEVNEINEASEVNDINAANSNQPRQSYLSLPLREAREFFEREYLRQQMERFEGNVSKTSQFIGMERSALHRKLKSLQLLGQDDMVAKAKIDKQRRA